MGFLFPFLLLHLLKATRQHQNTKTVSCKKASYLSRKHESEQVLYFIKELEIIRSNYFAQATFHPIAVITVLQHEMFNVTPAWEQNECSHIEFKFEIWLISEVIHFSKS